MEIRPHQEKHDKEEMERQEAKRQLALLKPGMLEKVRGWVERRHIHGELMEFERNGQVRRMRHFPSGKEKAPVYFDIHGGGFVWGMMEEGDLFCHHICEQLGYEVYAFDYPLGPEIDYPAALHWIYDTIAYMRENAEEFHIDPERMVVGGRSAGGNLSAALCLLAKERGEFQFRCQVLDHPYLDLNGQIKAQERYLGEEALSLELLGWLERAYAPTEKRKEICCSPLEATVEQLRYLPPAVIQTCERDSLRTDGDRYAEMLKQAGVPVIVQCYPDVEHGFTEVEGPEELSGQQWLINGICRHMEDV